MKNKTILVIDDSVLNLDILINILDEYDVIDATSGVEALEIVQEEKVDLILLDIVMPQMDGYEVCKKLKTDEKTKHIPIIFITSKTDELSIKKAYEMGGSDYVTKPFLASELMARVKKELKIQELISELKLLASTDPMTKLYNRRYFNKVAKHIFALSKRENHRLSLFIIDIDKFKNINDSYGHIVGDEVIIDLAKKLIEKKRESDIACRYGGEEFVMLLPNTSKKDALAIAEKYRKSIESNSVKLEQKQDIRFTVSIGVDEINFQNESDIEKALDRADKALYLAKKNGRNKACTID